MTVHAFQERKRSCIRIVLWAPSQASWVLLTDEALDDVLSAYETRVWIEQGFRALKYMGWQWHRTRHLDPAHVNPHRKVLAWPHWRRCHQWTAQGCRRGCRQYLQLPAFPSDAQTTNSRST